MATRATRAESPAPALQAEPTPGTAPESPNLVVVFQDRLLTVQTRRVPLREVLAAITKSAGVTFTPGGEAGEQVSIDLGPRPVREVLSELLERASYGYAFVDSPGGTGRAAATQVFLIKRGSASDLSGRTSMQQVLAAPAWPLQGQTDEHSPPPDEGALKQQNAVDAMFDACKAQACDTS